MFRKFKTLLSDILNTKTLSFLFFISIMFFLFLSNIIITETRRVFEGIETMEFLSDNNVYVNSDSTSDDKITQLTEDYENSITKMKKLYNFIDKNYTKYSYWEYNTGTYIAGNEVKTAVADNTFFEIYDINLVKGDPFQEGELPNAKITPIIVGYGLQDKYPLGKMFKEFDPNDGIEKKFKVIGILEENSEYPSLYDIGNYYSLDYTFFQPLDTKSLNNFANLDMSLGSLVIFNKNKKQLDKISDYSTNLGLFNMNFNKIEDHVTDFMSFYKQKILLEVIILIVVACISIFSMMMCILTIIKKNARNLTIHLMLGASLKDILSRFFFHIIILEFLAAIPTFIYIYVNNSVIDIFMLLIISLILSSSILIYPYFIFRSGNISNLSRREKNE